MAKQIPGIRTLRIFFCAAILCISHLAFSQAYTQFSSYMGGSGNDFYGYSKFLDGYQYNIGNTYSPDLNTTDGSIHGGNVDLMFSKYDVDGNIVCQQYYGDIGTESVDEAVYENGFIYLTGLTYSVNFKTTDGTSHSGAGRDFFVIKYDTENCKVVFSSVLGKPAAYETHATIAVENGEIYLVGWTPNAGLSTDGSSHHGGDDMLIAKYDVLGNLVFATYLGGSGTESASGVDIQNGMLAITGRTNSTDYFTTDGTSVASGNTSGFVTTYNSNGQIVFSTILGGTNHHKGSVGFNSTGEMYVLGIVNDGGYVSTDGTLWSGNSDIYLAKLDIAGNLLFGTFLDIYYEGTVNPLFEIDDEDNLIIADNTAAATFLVTDGSTHHGGNDAFIRKYDPNGNIIYSTLIGGVGNDNITDFYISEDGSFYFTGNTSSADFPVTDASSLLGFSDAFVAKHDPNGNQVLGTLMGDIKSGEYFYKLCVYDGKIFLLGTISFVAEFPVTEGAYHGGTDFLYVILDQCPDFNAADNTLLPTSQTVCQNGLVDELTGTTAFISGNALPIIYRNGVPSSQNDFEAHYQWQEAPALAGPWADIPGGTQQNVTPSPVVSDRYFRRLVVGSPSCGSVSYDTSNVVSVLVNANSAPTVDAGGVLNTCPGNSLSIGGSPSASGGSTPYTYAWTEGSSSVIFSNASNPNITPATAGGTIYTLLVTDGNGCKQIDQAIVNAYQADAGSDAGFCQGSSGVQIGSKPVSGLSGVTYSWSPTTNLSCTNCAQPIATPPTATTYTLTLTIPISGGGTCQTNDALLVSPISAPATSNFAGPDTTLCLGATATLGEALETGFSYTWAPGNYLTRNDTAQTTFQTGNLNMPALNPITYYVTTEKQGCIWVDAAEVSVIEARAGADGCGPRYVGEPDRTPNIDETYIWTKISGPGSFAGATNLPQVPVTASAGGITIYQLEVTYNGESCTDLVEVTDCGCTVEVSVEAPFDCPDFGLNDGDVKLVASAADNFSKDPRVFEYTWSPASGLSDTSGRIVYLTDDLPHTFTVTMTSPFDPSFSCMATFDVNQAAWSLPVFSSNDPSTCSGTSVQIGATPVAGYSYQWDGNVLSDPTISNPMATAIFSKDYYVTVTDDLSGCTIKDTATVTISNSIADAGAGVLICNNGVVTLGTPAQSNTAYSWTPAGANWQNGTNQFSAQPEVLVATNTTFILTTTHTPSSCVSVDSVHIRVGSPIPSFTLPNLNYCPSDVTPLTLGSTAPTGAGYTYSWSPKLLVSDATIRTPTVNDPKPGNQVILELTIENTDGCEQQATQTITPNTAAFTAGSNRMICAGDTIELGSAANPTGGITYSWSPTSNLSDSGSQNPTFTTTVAGTYTYTLSKVESGCTSTDEVTIVVETFSLPAIPSLTLCEGSCINIGTTAQPGVTYLWSPADGLSDPTDANPLACVNNTTTYTLTAVGINGCVATAEVAVGINPVAAPVVDIPTISACISETGLSFQPNFSPSGAYNYLWSPNDGTLSNLYSSSPEIYPAGIGVKKYTLRVTNPANGCYTTAEGELEVAACAYIGNLSVAGNRVWLDENADGYQDAGEPGIAGVTIELLDFDSGARMASTTTDANGAYLFSNITPGTYLIQLQSASLPDGLRQTTNPINPNSDLGNQRIPYIVSLVGGEENMTADFGYNWGDANGNSGHGALGNRVWNDANANGVQDAGEAGIGGVDLSLYYDSNGDGKVDPSSDALYSGAKDMQGNTGGMLATQADGSYVYHNLPPGIYRIVLDDTSLPGGSSAWTQSGDPDDFGKLATNPDHQSETLILAPGDSYLNVDFGYNNGSLNTLGDLVWLDENGNGAFDSGESGLANVSVSLLDASQRIVATTYTDALGNYLFEELPDGTYTVWVNDANNVLGELIQSVDPDNLLDSRSTAILSGGTSNLSQDFGYVPDAHTSGDGLIGDLVYLDLNNNSQADAGEGLEGIKLVLQQAFQSGTANAIQNADFSTGTLANWSSSGTGSVSVNGSNEASFSVNDGQDATITQTISNLDANTIYNVSVSLNLTNAIATLSASADTVNTASDGTLTLTFTTGSSETSIDLALTIAKDGTAGNAKISTADNFDMQSAVYTYSVVASTFTNENGNYSFGALKSNASFIIDVDETSLPSGLTLFDDPDGGTVGESEVNLSISGPVNLSQDFGYQAASPHSISGTLWADSNADGTLDVLETTRFEGVSLLLIDDNGYIIAQTTSASDGTYLFPQIPDGSYTLDVTDMHGHLLGYWHSLGVDSEYDPTSVSMNGSNQTGIDFGYYLDGAAVGNKIWIDSDGDDAQDVGEPGLPGAKVTMEIDYNDDGLAEISVSTISKHDGGYFFKGLLLDEDYDGTGASPDYKLIVVLPDGDMAAQYTPATPDQAGGNDLLDSDDHAGQLAFVNQGQQEVSIKADAGTEANEASNDFGYRLICANPKVDYAITSDGTDPGSAQQTTDYFWIVDPLHDDSVFYHEKTTQKHGRIRSWTYCEIGDWHYYYNPQDPDEYLFAIDHGSNTTPIEYIEIRVDDNALDRHVIGADDATFVMVRDWHVKTANDDALTASVNVRFYFPPNEYRQMLDSAKTQAALWGIGTPNETMVQWFKKDSFDPDADINETNSILSPFDITSKRLAPSDANGNNTALSSPSVENSKNHIQFNGITGFSGGTAMIHISKSALPVALSLFEANVENCDIRLAWTAESETTFSHYDLQRSTQGAIFRTIQTIASDRAGTARTYQYLDQEASKINYYRLRMVDLDGRIEYSKTLTVNLDCYDGKRMIIFPNPAVHEQHTVLNVKLFSQDPQATLAITDLTGRNLKTMILPVQQDWNMIRLNISDLAAGTYFIQHQRKDGTREVKKFVLQQ